jgi:hypothetical protein
MPFDRGAGDDRAGERYERRPHGRCAPSQVEQLVSQYHQYREHKCYPARDPSEMPEAPDLEQRGQRSLDRHFIPMRLRTSSPASL